MRTYLSELNLKRAAGLAAVVTIMTVPRLLQAGKPLGLFLLVTFLTMMLVGGAVTAWGRSAGMPGIVTDRRTFLQGVTIAVLLSVLCLPVQVLWFDPLLRQALAAGENGSVVELAYPSTVGGCAALLLWSAGFQLIFLQAAPMSFFARLTGRRDVAVCLCLALRVYVAYRQVVFTGISDCLGLFVLSAAGVAVAGCILFARFGLGPAMLLAAGMDLHLFFRLACDQALATR